MSHSYVRVIPRDLFNEGNLLKCYGQIYLNLEKLGMPAELVEGETLLAGGSFNIVQDVDGNLSIANLHLYVRGNLCLLRRPLNARGSYPLWLSETEDSDEIRVFNEEGTFSGDMLAFLGEPPHDPAL